MRAQLRDNLAKKSFNKKDLRQLRSLLSARVDDEVTETDIRYEEAPSPKKTPRGAEEVTRTPTMFSTNISAATQIHGLDLGPGSEIFYTQRGRLTSIYLGEDTKIGENFFKAGSIVYFFKEGSVDWVSLSQDTAIPSSHKQIPKLCARRLISFYRNGTLKETTLATNWKFGPHELPEESIVHFSNDGQLVWTHIARETSLRCHKQDLHVNKDSCLEFHYNGRVRSAVLAKPLSIQGHHFEDGSHVHFDMYGNLSLAQVITPLSFNNEENSGKMRLRFDRDGSISEITHL